ncbi:hypothetical protein PACTADRAFT_37633 [Pachysolen tannophilus NRRL Y-2460]|uniref:U3 small nucleolar RNA-associated protein 13 C-terminal domain-containing protein n=1 Tax=Pachysolen tannophilus NRRL Y-2460 TaxID=669874 RepID=A0A1E4U1B8_PACTA|nr:hypothetical protein PACTADRAFT_37633 [Pachysolen tannophilus NRRL Y-2460]
MSSALKTTFKSTDIVPFYVGSCSATLSRDGSILATPLMEDIVITNTKTNTIIHNLEGDGELVTCLQLSSDGRYLAIVSQSQQLRIFDISERLFKKSFKLSSPVYISACDPTSTLFAFGGSDGSITVWDIESGYVTHSLKGHGTTISAISFYGELNTTNWKLASGDVMGSVRIWDLVKRKCEKVISSEHTAAVRGVNFNATGEYLITGGRDNISNLFKCGGKNNNFKVIKSISAKHQIENSNFVKINDREFFYTAGGDCLLKIWDLENGQLVATSPKPLETVEELLIINVIQVLEEQDNEDSALSKLKLVLVLSDQTLCELNLNDVYLEDGKLNIIPISGRIAGNHGTIADMRFVGPDSKLLALATNSPSLRIIDPLNKPLEVDLYEGHKDLLNSLDSTSDGLWLATSSKDNEAILWRYNLEDSKFEIFARFIGHAGSVTCCGLPRNNVTSQPNFLITASADLTIKKWKIPNLADYIKSGKIPIVVKTSEYTRRAHEKDINSLDISPNNDFLATCSYDKLGKIWDLDSGEVVGILKGHRRGLWDIKFCAFDRLVVTGSGDKTLKLWSIQDFTCAKTFEGHTNSVQRVSFINRNQQLLSVGAEGLIKIWDIKSNTCLETLDNHDNRIWSLCVKADGQEFITADADGKISIWEDNTAEKLQEQEAASKLKVEQDQSLQNYMRENDFANAFLLALTLDHPMRLYNVLKSAIESNIDQESTLGSKELEKTILTLNDEQILKLFQRIRDWNINSKFFNVSQKLIRFLLISFRSERLISIPKIMGIIDAIIPYSERHTTRIDDLIEQSYLLDFAIEQM